MAVRLVVAVSTVVVVAGKPAFSVRCKSGNGGSLPDLLFNMQ
jgi:hypothetical protein